MAVMGGIALAAWEHTRATRDVDILLALQSIDIDTLLRSLVSAHIEPKRQPPVLALGSARIIQFLYQAPGTFVDIQIDLILCDSAYQKEALARRVPLRLPEVESEMFVLSCEDLILHKLLAGRIIDRADAITLVRLNKATLDYAYLLKWIQSLGLKKEWAETWQEAAPGEDAPPGITSKSSS
jgi:hypothetical protein